MPRDDAEHIAIRAFAFIASQPELVSRFCAITGIEPADLRKAANDPEFLAGVLDFIVAHEPDILAFADSASLLPETVIHAHRVLRPRANQWQSF